MILPSSHFFFTSSQAVDAIVQPLKQYFGLSSFIYQKNFDDGTEIRLFNQPKWCAFFYEHELYKKSAFESKPSQYVKNRILWNQIPWHSAVLSKAREFNIAHGITFVEPTADGCEFFFMGAPVDQPQVMQRYITRIDLLEKFIVYFREKAAPLIEQAKHNKIHIPNKFEAAPLALIESQCSFDSSGFLATLNPALQLLSPRERECADLLAKGYTVKMMGRALNLSPRTVETYVEHIKTKLNANSKADLIRVLSQRSI